MANCQVFEWEYVVGRKKQRMLATDKDAPRAEALDDAREGDELKDAISLLQSRP